MKYSDGFNRYSKMTQELNIRTILIEKINNQYHLSKLEIVQNNWKEGKHPKQCKGNCKLENGFMMTICRSCNWDDF